VQYCYGSLPANRINYRAAREERKPVFVAAAADQANL